MPTRVQEVDVAEARRLVGDGALLLDVREPDEWEAGHAPDAVHVPLGRLRFDLPAEGRVVVAVCRSGSRSADATAFLVAAGYTAVNLTGGMKAWATAGEPMVDGAGRPGGRVT